VVDSTTKKAAMDVQASICGRSVPWGKISNGGTSKILVDERTSA